MFFILKRTDLSVPRQIRYALKNDKLPSCTALSLSAPHLTEALRKLIRKNRGGRAESRTFQRGQANDAWREKPHRDFVFSVFVFIITLFRASVNPPWKSFPPLFQKAGTKISFEESDKSRATKKQEKRTNRQYEWLSVINLLIFKKTNLQDTWQFRAGII